MSDLLPLVIFLSLDSLVAAFGLAPFVPARAAQYRLAAWFGLCDMLGTLAGASEPVRAALPALAPHAAALGLIFAALVIIFRSRRGGWPVTLLLPILLSIDNLAAPMPHETSWLAGAVIAGIASATMAFAGMRLGALTVRPAIQAAQPHGSFGAHRDTVTSTAGYSPTLHPAACPLLASLILALS